jgi:hypothetical protein
MGGVNTADGKKEFLKLTAPDIQLQILSLASRAAQSRYLFWNLKSARTAEEVLEDIRDWEALQEPGEAGTHC